MFGSSKKSSGSGNGYDIETIIGRNTQFKGVVGGEGNIRIDGNLEGEIIVSGDVVIGEQGEVVGNIKAGNILISGIIEGNVQAKNKLEILGTGRLCGDVNATILCISEGAVFKGSSKMETEKNLEPAVMPLETDLMNDISK